MTKTLNQYEWMLLNGDKLAEAIKEDGRMNGPTADPLLAEVQPLESTGMIKQKARKLLKQKLEYRGVGHLFQL